MRYPKYKLAFPGKHVWVFNGKPMTQFDGYTLDTTAIGNGIVSANKLKGFYGDSAQIFLSAAPDHSLSGMEVNNGTIDGLTYYFGKGDAIISAYFRDSTVRNILLQQTNGGRISAIPLTGLSGDEVTLYNTPSSHYTFGGYEITGATLSGDKFVIGGTDITAKAIWVADPIRLLSLLQTSGGRISANKMSGYDGDSVNLFNTPSAHFKFSGYGLTGSTLDGNSFVFNGSNVSANARWQQDPIYTVLLTQTSGGTITAIPITGFSGDVITLSANPSAHYSLTGWGVTGATLTGNQLTIGSSNPSIVGKFKEDIKYNLTLQQSTGGTITANKLTGYSNDTITLSNTPSSNYNFNSYSLTGATLTGSQFNFGTSNVTAKANFTIKPTRTVTVNTAAGGTVVANPTTGYDGTVVTLSQTANAGYTFNNYSITGATLTGNQFKLTGGNVSVQPNYTHNVYSLTLQTDGHGKLAAGKTTGYYNDTTTLTATPSANYAFNSYSLTGGSITNNTFKWGTSNATAKANFVESTPVVRSFSSNLLRMRAYGPGPYSWTSAKFNGNATVSAYVNKGGKLSGMNQTNQGWYGYYLEFTDYGYRNIYIPTTANAYASDNQTPWYYFRFIYKGTAAPTITISNINNAGLVQYSNSWNTTYTSAASYSNVNNGYTIQWHY
jgi:hypothetical protein